MSRQTRKTQRYKSRRNMKKRNNKTSKRGGFFHLTRFKTYKTYNAELEKKLKDEFNFTDAECLYIKLYSMNKHGLDKIDPVFSTGLQEKLDILKTQNKNVNRALNNVDTLKQFLRNKVCIRGVGTLSSGRRVEKSSECRELCINLHILVGIDDCSPHETCNVGDYNEYAGKCGNKSIDELFTIQQSNQN